MNKLYVLLYNDVAIADFRIFNNFDDAFIEYLKFSVIETQKLLHDEESEKDDDSNEFESLTCSLQIYELDNSEFKTIKEFDIEFFQDILSSKEDFENYLNTLKIDIFNGQIPNDIREMYI